MGEEGCLSFRALKVASVGSTKLIKIRLININLHVVLVKKWRRLSQGLMFGISTLKETGK